MRASKDVLPIERELVAERAATLGRAGEKLEAALAALARAEVELAAASAEQRPALAARRRELRDVAAERLWFLLVQREALGLGHHEAVFQLHQVPAELRRLAGPRRRRP